MTLISRGKSAAKGNKRCLVVQGPRAFLGKATIILNVIFVDAPGNLISLQMEHPDFGTMM